MKIIIVSRSLFKEYLTRKGITDANVAEQDKIFFISILNPDEPVASYFSKETPNVKIMSFPDIEKDSEIPIIGTGKTQLFKAMTREQAAELYAFIKANKDKEAVMIHCTAGVSRSAAVGVFINDFIGGDYNELKRLNLHIQPNAHVYRLLHDEWYKDIAYNDAITGEPISDFKVEVLNPKSPEQEVALFNERHPDQHTSIQKMTKEEIQQRFGDEAGQLPVAEYHGRGYKAGDTVLAGARFIHPDGSSTYVVGVDPYRNEPEFEQFWLETNQYYGMVEETELPVLNEMYPDLREITSARKKMVAPGEYEAFASFGYGDEYTGIDLCTWLRLKNMLSFFKLS